MNKNIIRPDYNLGNVVKATLGKIDHERLYEFIQSMLRSDDTEVVKNGDCTLIAQKSSPISWATVTIKDKITDKELIYTSYPFIISKNIVDFRINKIEEWPDSMGTEATLIGSINDSPFATGFYDAKYVINKSKYKIGNAYKFNISAIVMQIEKRKDLTYKAKDPVDGKLKDYDSSQMTMFVQDQNYAEEFYFRFPVGEESQANITFARNKYYKLNYFMNSGSGQEHFFEMPIYVNIKTSKDYIPRKGDAVCGTGWMCGYLA